MAIQKIKDALKFLLVVALLFGATLLIEKAFFYLDSQAVREWIAAFGVWAPFFYVALLVTVIIVPPLPDLPVMIAGGLAFPWYEALFLTLTGDLLAATFNWGLARKIGRPTLRKWLGEKDYLKVERFANLLGPGIIFLMRLLPGFNFDLVSYAAGVANLSLRSFLLATLAGVLPVLFFGFYFLDLTFSSPISRFYLFFFVWGPFLTVPVLLGYLYKKHKQGI